MGQRGKKRHEDRKRQRTWSFLMTEDLRVVNLRYRNMFINNKKTKDVNR